MTAYVKFESVTGAEHEFIVDTDGLENWEIGISVQTFEDGDPVLEQEVLTLDQARELAQGLLDAVAAQEFTARVTR